MTEPRSTRVRRDSGQALVETALTLPLTLFLALGTLQLALLLQARVMAHYAAFKATREGAISYGDCERMTHAAVGSLLPVFTRVTGSGAVGHAEALGKAFGSRLQNKGGQWIPTYRADLDGGLDGPVVWIIRERPTPPFDDPNDNRPVEQRFDKPMPVNQSRAGNNPTELEVRLIFWAPMRIPFANWVMSRMFLAHFGLQEYRDANPIMPTQTDAAWLAGTHRPLSTEIAAEYVRRFEKQQYVFPVEATYVMRMMTPPRAAHFRTQSCLPAPEVRP